MDRYLYENGLLEAMDTWPKYGCMPDGRFIRLTKENEKDYVPYVHYEDMIQAVTGTPHADVAPVIHAHWINHFDDLYPVESTAECSNCHEEQMTLLDNNYCPHCGAKMDEEVE